ncbi:hypothetical protein QTL86_12525 [Cellulosilyticum sp. ST5]|uniref:Uncharacterized protein n=1 Tax=Cellulosilyticum lentocellum (strain ATCC 49066 / DSM 5427 / NCIMB 11756 / RHM5) TaxID=642492 RepID=F2JRF0_CELLD|nr:MULTISPECIES: hypothetical protein [Cellulosilyticum]ADZ82759.1 hypothetical protein Clole_1027 [Cellulosilyticum lentocellum DSM 5427]QEH68306.1 hypothetical protein EKH84_07835 [Cellulosilyticum sp. WCF-2]
MAANPRHKKARMLRDFMIETQTVNMFKEEEKDDTIFFRSIYPMGEDKKQVVITINDTVYLGVQSLLMNEIPEERNAAILDCLNECNLELPTVKYVLTKDQCVVVSMFFPADEAHFNAGLIMGAIVQVMKNVSEKHYEKIKAALA